MFCIRDCIVLIKPYWTLYCPKFPKNYYGHYILIISVKQKPQTPNSNLDPRISDIKWPQLSKIKPMNL